MSSHARYQVPDLVVNPCSSAKITCPVPLEDGPYRPSWIQIPDDVAPHFMITDLHVGRFSQLAGISCVPSSLFAESAPVENLHFDFVDDTNPTFSIWVTNVTNSPQVFRACLCGHHEFRSRSGLPDYLLNGSHVVFGLGHHPVRPRAKMVLNVQPTMTICPARLFLPSDVANSFAVESVTCTTSSVDPSLLDGKRLSSRNDSISLQPNPLVTPANQITISAINTDRQSLAFTGAFVCRRVSNLDPEDLAILEHATKKP